MVPRTPRRSIVALGAGGIALSLALAGCSAGGDSGSSDGTVSLTWLVDNGEATVVTAQALVDAFEADNPDISIEVQTRPQGADGDNLVKTRLATGEMDDLFSYNSGSLFQALSPDDTMVNLDDQGWVDKLDENFVKTVSTDNGVYGVPLGQSMAGAVLYNKDIYEQLGLEIPTTWDEFIANSEAIKQAGTAAPIVQTYGDTWTSQLFVLGDFNNVLAEDPNWADDYTNNKAKYVDQPAFAGFEHLQEAFEKGLFNEDFASATYNDGVSMVATGAGAQYPMLTFAASQLMTSNPDAADVVGTFPLPGPDADTNGLTVWMPGGVYIPKSTEGDKLEAAKKFLDFVATPASCDIQSESTAPQGPFVVEGCDLPEDVPAMISDMQPYFDEGKTNLALEFLSPIKGPALEQITVAVGSGITSAADGAAQYDEDVKKQAQQLGIEGW
ncbi:extracellular solute-binding protein [Agromyces tardus]|jgi:raffinose/stachyose/melibiose transport system substrate-binding protein|uniref:Extracellular solute-binding protein n=1 Tax=Agromyces tardus TaxID=2583849 RepID=A0A3M8AMR4_9MICO|nr:extracellular solute-binding protein [Agromyces tardus]RNB51927.1 extracellular solute-binding protein [Agromyces tardus]